MPIIWWIMIVVERISRAWTLTWQGLRLLKSYRALLLLPLASGVFCILASVIAVGGGALVFDVPLQNPTLQSEVPLVTLMFEYPFGMQNARRVTDPSSAEERQTSEHAWLCVLLFYLANNFVITYFSVALASVAYNRFRGGNATLDDGLTVAWQRKGKVLQWAVLASTIGVLIRMIRRQGRLGLWISSLIGAAWSLASFFAAPLIANEDLSAGEALQRSSSLIYRKWGEAVSARFSFGLLFLILFLPGSIALFSAIHFGKFVNLASACVMTYWILLAVFMSTAKQLFVVALYMYAQDDQVVKGFYRSDCVGAWTAAEVLV